MLAINKLKSILTGNQTLINGALFSVFSFVNKGFGFILLMILAGFISPGEYGYLSLFNTVMMFLGYFRALSTEGYISVAFFHEGEGGIKNTVSCVFATSFLFSLLLLALLLIFGGFFARLLDLPLNILYISVPITFFSLYANLNLDYVRIRERVGLYGLLSCGNALLNFVLAILLVKYMNKGWEGRVYSEVICAILFGVIGLVWFLRSKYIGVPDLKYWKQMLIWGIPLIPHLATHFFRQGCDSYIINNYHTIEDVGLFNFALTLANIISMIGYGFNQSNSVDIYKVLGNPDISNERKSTILEKQRKVIRRVYFVATVFVTIVGYFLIPMILPKYAGAMNYYLLLAIYAFGICLYLLYTNYLFYYKKTKSIMYVTFSSAILHLLLSLTLTQYSLFFTCCIYCITQFFVVAIIRKLALRELEYELTM